MARALAAAVRGLASGMLVGAIWWVVEATLNWAAGGLVPGAVSLRIGALDLAVAGIAGLGLGAMVGGGAPLALALTAVYGFLRVYRPPGFGAEALFVVLAAGATGVALRLARTTGLSRRMRFDPQNVCRYLMTSTFSASVPVSTEKSMNF